MKRLRRAATARLMRWAIRRHGRDDLPVTIDRRRIYIIPTRFGIALGLLLVAMLLAGLNYNSNLALAFGFMLASLVLVAMHHCHRNLQGLIVDAGDDVDAFAGGASHFDFLLRNDAAIDRCDIEVRCRDDAAATHSVGSCDERRAQVAMPALHRGIVRLERFELRTRHPFGWFRAWTYVHTPLTAFVAPEPRGSLALPVRASGVEKMGQAAGRGDEDFAGLRPYVAGEPLKHMAWKVLARGAEPAVRIYAATATQSEWLDWSDLIELDTEARLSQLCRWVLDSDRGRGSYGLRLPGLEITPTRGAIHRRECLRALARYGTEKVS